MLLRRILDGSMLTTTANVACIQDQLRGSFFGSDLSSIAFANKERLGANRIGDSIAEQRHGPSRDKDIRRKFADQSSLQYLQPTGPEERRRPTYKRTVELEPEPNTHYDHPHDSLVKPSNNSAAFSTAADADAFVTLKSSFVSAKDSGRYGELSSSTNNVASASSLSELTAQQAAVRTLFDQQPLISIGAKGVPNIPLLPVRYLKYYSHGRRGAAASPSTSSSPTDLSTKQSPSALGIPLPNIATPYLSRAEERLHAVRQRNILAQIGARKDQLAQVVPTTQKTEVAKVLSDSPGFAAKAREMWEAQRRLPFRCLSCFHVFDALPSKLLNDPANKEKSTRLMKTAKFRSRKQYGAWKSLNTIAARREEETRNPTMCPQCRSRKVQWLMEYCHRSLHTSKVR